MTDTNSSWPNTRRASVVTDPPGWFTPFANNLATQLTRAGILTQAYDRQSDVPSGNIAFYLSCTGITPQERLALNNWNVVVHASDLPQGRGFSPLVWQILEGKSRIPLTMIAMADDVDSGDVLMQRHIEFGGHELNEEMRDTMGQAIVKMCLEFALSDKPPSPSPQHGTPSWYNRRGPQDSALDAEKSLAEQFNILRVADNAAYPAFFDHKGHRYVLSITRQPIEGSNDA